MALTLTQAESALVGAPPDAGAGIVGAALASAGFIATGASPVAALAPAITQALLACGVTPVDVAAPSDADLAALPAASWPKFLDIAALLLLEQATIGFVGRVKTIKIGGYSKEVFGGTDLNALLADRRAEVKRKWGYGAGRVFAGYVDLGFATTNRTQTDLLRPWG